MTKRCKCGSFIPYSKTRCARCKDTPPRVKTKKKKAFILTVPLSPKESTLTMEERMALQELDDYGKTRFPSDEEIEMGDIIEDASGHNLSFGCVDRIVKALVKAKVGFKR